MLLRLLIKKSLDKFMIKTLLASFFLFIFLSIISVIAVNHYFHNYFILNTQLSLRSSVSEIHHEEFGITKVPSVAESLSLSLNFVPDILNGISPPNNKPAVQKLSEIRTYFGMEIIFVMNAKGDVVLCSSYGENNDKTLYGQNFSSKLYFREAMHGRTAVQPEINPAHRERGVFFASPVVSTSAGRKIIGVIVIEINTKVYDSYLSRKFSGPTSLVSPNGIVFASNRGDWVFKSVKTLFEEINISIGMKGNENKFNNTIKSFNVDYFKYDGSRFDVIRVSFPYFRDIAGDWEIIGLEKYPSRMRFLLNLAVVFLSFICSLGFLFFILQREAVREKKFVENQIFIAMKRTEQLYRVIPSAIFSVDENKIITSWNNMAANITGYSAEEVIGHSCLTFALAPCTQGCGLYNKDIPKPITGRICEIIRKDGVVRKISKNVDVVYDTKGAIVGGIECFEDITEKYEAAQELIETREKALLATKAKSVFLANMSHEIRTPMNAILGFAQVLERDPNLSPEQSKFVQIINRSGNHLLKLINDVLDMSKIETGSLMINKTTFSFYDMIRDIEIIFKSHAGGKGLSLLVEYEDNVPEFIVTDEGKLRQVFINILGNAIKFTETGGVAFRIGADKVSNQQSEDDNLVNIIVEIEDSGLGIPEKDLIDIFEPFRQSDAGFKMGGTGLGLPLAKKFVELLGGDITLKSELGVGTLFRFIIPVGIGTEILKLEQSEESRNVIGLQEGTPQIKILVVDDIELNRSLLSNILEPIGFEIKEGVNGQQAIEIFREWSPHIILMDMRMPVMDGYEAIRLIKSEEAGKKTPIIAVTASAFEDNKDEVMATGTDDYLRKPFRRKELLAMLSKHLGIQYIYDEN